MKSKYAESECIAAHPAYKEGYNIGYREGYIEAVNHMVKQFSKITSVFINPPSIIVSADKIDMSEIKERT